MLKMISYHLMLIRITLYKQFHNPTIMLSLILITSLCLTVLQLSSQLVIQVMHDPLPIKNAEKSYQLHIQQGPLAIDGKTMLFPETLYAIQQWPLPINVITQTVQQSQWLVNQDEQHKVAKMVISNNYLEQFDVQTQLGSLDDFDRQEAVIDEEFWRYNLFSDPNVIGSYINLSNKRYEIKAVLKTDLFKIASTEKIIDAFNKRPGMILTKEEQVTFFEEGEATLLASPNVFLQSGLSFAQLEEAVSSWVTQYNERAPQHKQLSFSIDSLREVMYGSWYYLAPSLLMASLLILCIGLTAMGSLCLAHAGKSQRNVVLSYVLGANKYAIYIMEGWIALTISVVANMIAFILCTMVDKYLQSLGFVQWLLSPTFTIVACSIVVIWVCIFLLLILPHQTIDRVNLNSGLASSGKGQTGMFSLSLMKKIINIQVFAISIFLLLGVSYLISNVIKLSPLLATSYENIAYVQIEKFHNKSQSRGSQAVIVNDIEKQLVGDVNVSEVAMLSADPLSLSLSLSMCKMPDESPMVGSSYVSSNLFSVLNAKTLAGEIPEHPTQQQVIINKQAALELFGRVDDVIGEKLPCSGSIGEKQVVAIIDMNRFVPKELSTFIDQEQPVFFSVFDWGKMSNKPSEKATFVFKFKENLPFSLIDKIKTEHKNILQMSTILVVEEQLKRKGREMRLSISISSIITLSTILVAGFSLYGGLKYQTMLREHQLAVFKCLGMPNKQLIFFVAKDNLKSTSISLSLALLFTVIFEFIFGEQAISLNSMALTVCGIVVIYLCASIGPCYQLMRKKNMRELLY